jgi:hypothetical protein
MGKTGKNGGKNGSGKTKNGQRKTGQPELSDFSESLGSPVAIHGTVFQSG